MKNLPFTKNPPPPVFICRDAGLHTMLFALVLALVCSSAFAEYPEVSSLPESSSTSPPTDASSETAKPSAGSFFDRIKGTFSGDSQGAAPAKDKRGDAADSPSPDGSKNTATSEPGFFDKLKKALPFGVGGASPTKIKDINTFSTVSSKVLDPYCQNLVEPFGVTDNVASLGVLMVKMKLSAAVSSFTGQSGGGLSMDPLATIKQAAKGLNWLPMDAERLLGESMHNSRSDLLPNTGRNVKLYATANRTLQDVLSLNKEPIPYNFQIFIVKSDGVNAAALPGGFIYIDRGLLNSGYLHFAVAHEVAHVLQRHQTREYQSRLIDSIDSLTGLNKLLDSVQASPGAIVGFLGGLKNLFLRHSEEQELQADACATRLVSEYAKGNTASVSEIQKYADSLPKVTPSSGAQPEGAKLAELWDGKFDAHPNSIARIANLQLMVNNIKNPKPAVQK